MLRGEHRGGKEHWGLDKAPETEITRGHGPLFHTSVIWNCLSHSLSLEHTCFFSCFLSFEAHLSFLHFLTTSAHIDAYCNLVCDPHLALRINSPLVLAIWVCTLNFLYGIVKALNLLKDGIIAEALLRSSHWGNIKKTLVLSEWHDWIVDWITSDIFGLAYIKLRSKSKDACQPWPSWTRAREEYVYVGGVEMDMEM